MACGFVLTRHFVFAPSARVVHGEIVRYVLVNAVAVTQTWALSVYLASVLTPGMGAALAQSLAHAAGIALPVVSSYIGHKYFTFRTVS